MANEQRDFTSVSPSAKTLLLMKGYTNIPCARRAAELISYPEKYEPDFNGKDFTFWFRVAHFEARYRSIDTLLADIETPNILELSSGFSFRGLDMTNRKNIHYIDTDLPEVIGKKKELVSGLKSEASNAPGKLEILPLNALDEPQFNSVASRFGEGPLAVVNEGLLMYLNTEEKKQLCHTIHNLLSARGGYWITTDIYLKNTPEMIKMQKNDELQRFLDQHNIEENKFDSFESAAQFFKEQGFVLDAEAEPDYSQIEAIQHAIKQIPREFLKPENAPLKIQTTWRLRIA